MSIHTRSYTRSREIRRPVLAVATFVSAFALLLWSGIFTTVPHKLLAGMSKLNDGGWGHDAQHYYTLETVKGFFLQDSDGTDAAHFDFIASNFGLASTAPLAWRAFDWSIQELNKATGSGISYRVLYLGRHGQGWHNVAESHYGTAAWDDRWSKLNGDENSTWGPDALLTPTGEGQAREIAAAWDVQGEAGAPLPTGFYVSPLTRAVDTLTLTFGNGASAPVVLEGLRETNGVHTCDKRRPKTWIAERTPRLVFERGFVEEDELWEADVRETDDEQQARIRAALVKIIDNDESLYISITAHSGTVAAALRAIGHRPFTLPTGAMIPVVIKVTKRERSPMTSCPSSSARFDSYS